MGSLNHCTLIGHLGDDPEYYAGDVPAKNRGSFRLATTYKDRTDWHHVVCFGRQADVAYRYLQKGSKVALTGYLSYRTYDAPDGTRKYFTDIVASEIVLLSAQKQDAGEPPPTPPPLPPPPPPPPPPPTTQKRPK